MKNRIIMIILVTSIILVLFLTIFGFKMGNFEIPSISKMIDKNNEINSELDKVTELTSVSYPEEVSNLESTIDTLNIQKEKYEQLSGSNLDEGTIIYETEKYDIDYLWTTIGQYATKNDVKLSIDVKQSTGTDLYNLYFTVQGEYVDISSFITKIENDSDLSFRIYNFKLVTGSSDIELKATFTVKDVNIDSETLKSSQTSALATGNDEDQNTVNDNS